MSQLVHNRSDTAAATSSHVDQLTGGSPTASVAVMLGYSIVTGEVNIPRHDILPSSSVLVWQHESITQCPGASGLYCLVGIQNESVKTTM